LRKLSTLDAAIVDTLRKSFSKINLFKFYREVDNGVRLKSNQVENNTRISEGYPLWSIKNCFWSTKFIFGRLIFFGLQKFRAWSTLW
jgi:hypothetical protein